MLRRPPGRVVVQHATAAGTSMEERDDGCEQKVRGETEERRRDETRGGKSVGRADARMPVRLLFTEGGGAGPMPVPVLVQ